MAAYRAKRAVVKGIQHYRLITRFMRVLPDFLIIGAQKCGTDSLFRYLGGHPCIKLASSKEAHYFDLKFDKGINWYRSHFPLIPYKYSVKRLRKQDLITGEATPYYLFHPHAPGRAAAIVPHVKLIVLLRNPADRAYSHYNHEVKYKF
ncbi:MAG: sulfotransferase domain-containing protein, partial [Anaerolineae bacterium]